MYQSLLHNRSCLIAGLNYGESTAHLLAQVASCRADVQGRGADKAHGWQTLTHQGDMGHQPLALAIVKGQTDVALALIDAGVPLSQGLERSVLPACLAASAGNATVLKALHARGVDLSEPDFLGRAPVHLAAVGDHPGVLSWLAQQGQSLESEDASGQRPLHAAAAAGAVTALRALLDAGVNANALCKGESALHRCLQGDSERHFDCARALLDAGIDIDRRDGAGLDALQAAKRKWPPQHRMVTQLSALFGAHKAQSAVASVMALRSGSVLASSAH